MHPRVSLHQVAFLATGESNAEFLRFCAGAGIPHTTLVTPMLATPEAVAETRDALAATGVRCATVNHVFAPHPDLKADEGQAAAGLLTAIDTAATLGASAIYLLTGARGRLDWEAAADRFAELIAPCLPVAEARGIRLLAENAGPFNADIHIAHTLTDATRLAEIAGIGLCLDLHGVWFEGGLAAGIARAAPRIGLVQISDYVLGDRTAPCRAVPGDGVIANERLIGDLLDLGYEGVFDLELTGPRIAAEGPRAASIRAAEWLSECLTRLGA